MFFLASDIIMMVPIVWLRTRLFCVSFLINRGCKACGREEIERGCNGEGRIQGGIATVPGFGWWPIKAYRPCPGFVASGGRYKRRGQSMDEVTSGGGRTEASANAGRKDSSRYNPNIPFSEFVLVQSNIHLVY